MNIILLCGGKGERLRPLTTDIPKPMVQIKDKPILWYILKQVEKYKLNYKEIFISVGYQAHVIKTYFLDNFNHLDIKIIDNGDVDIIDRVKSVSELSPDEDLLILYGDTIADVNIDQLISFCQTDTTRSVITVWPLSTEFGVVEFNDNHIVSGFKEKPKLNTWINIGYFVLRKNAFQELQNFAKFEDFLKFFGSSNMLKAYRHEGHHLTVNSLVELDYVEKNIGKLFDVQNEK